MTERPLNSDGSEHCSGCYFKEYTSECVCYECVGYGTYYCPTSNCAYDLEITHIDIILNNIKKLSIK